LGRIRVLHLVTDLERGGAPLLLSNLLPRLAGAGLEVSVSCLAAAGPVMDKLAQAGIEVWPLGARTVRDVQVLRRLARLLRRVEPAILHTWLMHSNVSGRLVGRLVGVRGIVSSICTAEHMARWHVLLENATCRLADCVVCNSESVRRFMIREGHLPADRLVTIYHGVDTKAIAAAEKADLKLLGVDAGGPVICFVGRLDPVKGLSYLLEALAEVRRTVPAELVVAGDGPMLCRLRQLERRLNLAGSVHWLGFRDDVASIVKACEVFVSSSLQEGFGLATAEAMAAGVPVVATAVEGTVDLISDQREGLLVPPGSSHALAEGIVRLLTDPQLARRLADRARQTIHRCFDIEGMVERHLRLYERLLSPAQARAMMPERTTKLANGQAAPAGSRP